MEKKIALDEQTGKSFELIPETPLDIAAAIFSGLYLIAMLAFLSWVLFDISTERNLFLKMVFPKDTALVNSPLFRLIAYTVIGGGLGGVVNGIRGFIIWHAERMAFGWRFLWKYITLPLLGIILAAIVFAIIRGGIAALSGDFAPSEASTIQALSAFAIGALTGYGSHKVFKWLDGQVKRLFRIVPITEVEVPDLKSKTQNEAEAILKESNLNLGKVGRKANDDPVKIGKIIDQNPPPYSMISKGGSVDITIVIKA